MFGISFGELILIGIVVLIVFGPKRLPEVARQIGKISGEIKKTSDAFRREFYNSVYKPSDETRSIERDLRAMLTENEKIEQVRTAPEKTEEDKNERKD